MKSRIKPSLIILVIATLMCGTVLAKQEKGKRNGGKNRQASTEAIAACADLIENDVCSFIAQDKEMSGTCKAGRTDDLMCRAERGNRSGNKGNQERGNRQQNNTASIAACSGLAVEASCSVTSSEGEERFGVCQSGRNDEIKCKIERPDKSAKDSETSTH